MQMLSLPRRGVHIRWRNVGIYILLALLLIYLLFPFVWSLSTSFKGFKETYRASRNLIPREPTLSNYAFLFFKLPRFPRQLLNSFIVTGGTVILTALLATTMGYGFARINFRGRDLIFYLVIVSMFIPRSGGLMAQYELMDFLKLRNSLLGLILAFSAGLPVSMFIMRQTFLYVPRELEEAAAIDGASLWQIFWKVALPMCTSGLVVVCILKFVQVWGDYLFTMTMIDDADKFTAGVGVAIVKSFVAPDTTSTGTGQTVPIAPDGVLGAANVVVMAPVILLYLVLQKWFVRGLTEGILKF
ncbi:MAG: carbohydrate ABC transporter permease [Chloroflexi bacterium]|nr:carbohydrate ABC transporter permease [Chloroflexota bacterium]